jgi:ATP-dependent Clp protease ATP-binding subunit ClpA
MLNLSNRVFQGLGAISPLLFAAALVAPVTQAAGDAVQAGPTRGSPNFEQYTEDSRKALFFARFAVSEHGGSGIDSEHLLLGILRAAPEAVTRLMAPGWSLQQMQERVVALLPTGQRVEESVEIPFSRAAADVIVRASEEAIALNNNEVRPEHLLLVLLSFEEAPTGQLLREAGLTRDAIVSFLQQQ